MQSSFMKLEKYGNVVDSQFEKKTYPSISISNTLQHFWIIMLMILISVKVAQYVLLVAVLQ